MLKQSFGLRLQQKLSPQQIQLMKLIQLSSQALEDRIEEELEENPALEDGTLEQKEETDDWDDSAQEEDAASDDFEGLEDYLTDDDTPDYERSISNYSADDELYEAPIVQTKDMRDILHDQLAMRSLAPQKEALCKYLIGTLEDDGYLRRALVDIVDDLAFSMGLMIEVDELQSALEVIQSMEPAGIAATDVQSCLAAQIQRKPKEGHWALALKVVTKHFASLSKRHYSKIMESLHVSEEELKAAIEAIGRLNPKPGAVAVSGGSMSAHAIIPDFTIEVVDNQLELRLNGRNAPELNVSRSYKDMLSHYKEVKQQGGKADKEAFHFIKSKIDAAKWFVEAIKQRQHTLLITMSAIMNYQKAYFLSGDDRKLRPMILKDIADEIGMDISTVSRVASQKYVQTPFGTKLIKTFFSESMTNAKGEEVSTREIKKILEDAVSEEDSRQPMADDALAKLLKDKGYPIARRTIAKYREQLNIPVARLRKTL